VRGSSSARWSTSSSATTTHRVREHVY
jgi:hypothetical protein